MWQGGVLYDCETALESGYYTLCYKQASFWYDLKEGDDKQKTKQRKNRCTKIQYMYLLDLSTTYIVFNFI